MSIATAELVESSIVGEADALAEQAAAAQRSGGSGAATEAQMRAANDPERSGEFDANFDEALKSVPEEFKGTPGTENGGVVMPLEGAPKAEPKMEPAPEAATTQETAPAAETPAAEEKKSLLDSVLAEPKAPAAPADPYDGVKLRSDASPKTQETFAQLKTIAREREQAARAEAEATKKQLEELQAKQAELEKRTVPPETEQELKELREFRARYGAEQSPEFRQKYDGRVDSNYQAIFSKLKDHGLADTEIQKLQAFTPQDRDATIESFLAKLPSASRRFIELKLADNLNAVEEKAKALEEIKAKAAEIIQKEKTAPVEQAQERFVKTAAILKPALAKLPWVHVKDIPPNTPPEEAKAIEAHNQFAAVVQEDLKFVLQNDTPEARAEAAIAVPLARFYQRENQSLATKVAALEKELGAIKAASRTSRTARSSAPTTPTAAPAPKAPEDRDDAIDSIFNEVTGAARR